jgi:hypothetical protein
MDAIGDVVREEDCINEFSRRERNLSGIVPFA